jgi:hypothetical protein
MRKATCKCFDLVHFGGIFDFWPVLSMADLAMTSEEDAMAVEELASAQTPVSFG